MLARKLTLDKIPHLIRGQRVLMRVDFNVPLKANAADVLEISDTKRIVSTLPTINFCLEHGAKSVVLMSHLGRPDGRRQDKFSMRPVVPALEDLLQRKVDFQKDCVGQQVERVCGEANNGKIVLLENLRFHMAEEGKGINAEGEKVKADK